MDVLQMIDDHQGLAAIRSNAKLDAKLNANLDAKLDAELS